MCRSGWRDGRRRGAIGRFLRSRNLRRSAVPTIVVATRGLAAGRVSHDAAMALALAIMATSVVFSGAHYVGPHGEAVEWFSASFRCFAGVFFATLFVYRGFGIAAGTHAFTTYWWGWDSGSRGECAMTQSHPDRPRPTCIRGHAQLASRGVRRGERVKVC